MSTEKLGGVETKLQEFTYKEVKALKRQYRVMQEVERYLVERNPLLLRRVQSSLKSVQEVLI